MGVFKPTPTRASSTLPSSLWRGRVVELAAGGTVWIVIPRLTGPTHIGPIPSLVQGLTIGESVIVGAIENSVNDLIVLAVG